MAQVAEDVEIQARIDRYLAYLFSEWGAIPEIAAEWDKWHEYDQFDFVIEWPIREDRLQILRKWFDQDLLTQEQRTRYGELLRLVEEHRPTLERMIAD